MRLSKKTESEVLKVYDTWLQSYMNGDVETYDSFLDDKYHFIGSTNNEEFLSKKDTTNFFKATADQLAGKTQLRNETKVIEKFEELVFITHLFDAWFLNGTEWNYYGRFRFTNALKKNNEGWRFIYQHFSIPDSKALEGKSIGYDQISIENLQLREAIQRRTVELEAKNRELEIEGALERIRAQALAMKTSSDLLDIVVTMRNEFIKLGQEAHYFWHMMWLKDYYEKAMTSGDGTKIGMIMKLPRLMHGEIPVLAKWEKSKKPIIVYPMDAETAVDYVDKMISLGDFQQVDPQAPSLDDVRHIGGLTFIMARTTHGEIGFSLPGVVKNPPVEALKLLEQFAGAFDLAHRRFLDLQKAEKQAREAQVEVALERVRAKAMGMHSSKDISKATVVVFNELSKLGIDFERCGIVIFNDTPVIEVWSTPLSPNSTEVVDIVVGNLDTNIHPLLKGSYKAWSDKKKYYSYELKGNEVKRYYTLLEKAPDYRFPKIENYTESQIINSFYFHEGAIFIYRRQALSEETKEILYRFTSVFSITYRRYQDIIRAEAQAWEVQIELALEKVRSRTMGMQRSDELRDTAMLLFQQVEELGIKSFACGFNIWDDDKKFATAWMASKDRLQPPFKTNSAEDVYLLFREAEKRGDSLFILEQEGKELVEHYKYLVTIPEVKKLNEAGLSFPTYQIIHCAYFSKGYLMFITLEPVPDAHDIFKRFAKVFEQTYTRFLDLQKAEAQTREAQIETALERVRSRTMAMQHSDELQEASFLLDEQVRGLGIETWGCAFNIYGEKESTEWFGNAAGVLPTYKVPRAGIFKEYYQKGKKGESLLIKEFSGDECVAHYEYMSSLPVIGDVLKNLKNTNNGFPTYQIDHVVYFKYGYLLFITREDVPDAHEVFKRFAKVFEQTYTRFLDLQKAEAQAREAQIQLSLERLRAKSMAMQSSDELHDVFSTLFQQFDVLGIQPVSVFLSLFDKEKRTLTYRASGKSGMRISDQQTVSMDSLEVWSQLFDKWKNDNSDEVEVIFYAKEILPTLFELLSDTFASLPAEERMTADDFPDGGYTMHGYTPFGYLGYNHTREATEEEKNILSRFATEFSRVYQRFLDIEKAEAQAREAQIETALERVRSRSMAMHNTSELQEVIHTVHKEFIQLNIASNGGSFIAINNDITTELRFWGSGGTADTAEEVHLPRYEKPFTTNLLNRIKSGPGFFTEEYTHKEKKEFFTYLFKHEPWSKLDSKLKNETLSSPGGYTRSCCVSTHTSIVIINHFGEKFSAADNDILKRFAKVFEQTYTRFLDLQKAEAQAREATIETALERVRSRTLAMQKSDELADTSIVIFEQLINLGIEPNRLFIGIIKEETHSIEAWATNEDGTKIDNHFTLNTDKNISVKKMYEDWKNKKTSTTIDMQGEELQDYFHYLSDEMKIPFQGGLSQKRRVQTIAYFGQGLIGMASPDEQPIATTQLLERFAAVFNLTYTRFNDLKIAEAHAIQAEKDLILLQTEKKKAEEALSELQLTQKQLIQSEKMASLGELTAGIAHEIQNPLNFVNNFSEVSQELIDELKEELELGHMDGVKDILNDVIHNLQKINHHGKRAEGIVKGMLQHSRKSSAVKEATDINTLCDEFLRLSYYGLRAKDKSFNATLVTDFDENLPKANIFPQELGRVILNLLTNAFYAVNEKKELNIPGYKPTVSIGTKENNGTVEIKVSDNGKGIPKHVLEKIYQPFFTTKPTGKGTGLGLSMSYDIITKGHGGSLKVVTENGKGTEFIIELPLTHKIKMH